MYTGFGMEINMDSLSLRSMAKVNFGLDVLRKRPDGYHDLRMIMQTVRLSDTITMKKTANPEIRLTCNLGFLPTDERNLAYRAAALIKNEYHISEGVEITLEKHIPVAAGLAGGSGNAAAVLGGMNQMFDLGISQEDLQAYGLKLGADVPYCVLRGTALAEGVGEILTPLPPLPDCTLVLVKPSFSVSTKYVFTHLAVTEKMNHPDIDGMIKAIENDDLCGITSRMGNVLENVTIPAYPQIQEIKDVLSAQGALASLMSGSGPTVFGVYNDPERAKAATQTLREQYPNAFIRFAGLYQRRDLFPVLCE